MYVCTDGQTARRTDGQNIPCILQDIVPLGPLPKKDKSSIVTKGPTDEVDYKDACTRL